MITSLWLTTVSDAALSISPSKSTVSPGETFNVTVSVSSSEAGAVNLSASNGTLSQTYIDLMTQSSVTVTCVAGSSGTVSFSASGKVANYTTETEGTQSATASVTIKEPEPVPPPVTNTDTSSSGSSSSGNSGSSSGTGTTNKKPTTSTTTTVTKSSNSKLDSLEIAEGTITPEFSSGTKEYSISIPNEVTKLSISAVPDSSKATVKITGNEELQVGENTIEVVVTAEDGSKTTYKILAKRAQPVLSLQTLTVGYIDENGEKLELILNPVFVFDTYEYAIDTEIPHTVKNLEILGTANRENAIIEVIGNEELKTGENEITIKVTVTDEAGLEEQKTYMIKVQKEEEPVVTPLTTMEKMGNWFNGIGITISTWLSENFDRIIIGMLMFATAAFIGLTIYFVFDYKNYKKLLTKAFLIYIIIL